MKKYRDSTVGGDEIELTSTGLHQDMEWPWQWSVVERHW